MRASGAASLLNVDGRLGAELARKLQSRVLRRAHADDATRTHLLSRGDGEDADRPGTLDDDRVAPLEATGARSPVEGTDAGGQGLGQRSQQQAHVVRQLVDLGAGQLAQIDIDVLGPAAPEVRRLLEAEIAAVIDRRQALIGISG